MIDRSELPLPVEAGGFAARGDVLGIGEYPPSDVPDHGGGMRMLHNVINLAAHHCPDVLESVRRTPPW